MSASQVVCAKGRASGLRGPWRLVFLLVLETLEPHPSFHRTQFSAARDRRGPFRGRPSAQTALVLLRGPQEPVAEAGGLGWRRWWPGIPRAWHLPGTSAGKTQGGRGLEHRESLWAPRPPPPHPGRAQGRDGTPRTSWGTLLSLGGAPGRGLGRGQQRRLPASHWVLASLPAHLARYVGRGCPEAPQHPAL